MSIKSILAVYSGDAHSASGLRFAILMARKYDAHLTAAVLHGTSTLSGQLPRYVGAELRKLLQDLEQRAADEIRIDFDRLIAAESPPIRSGLLDLRGPAQSQLAQAARGYDIVVMGARAAIVGREQFVVRPDIVALQSGRPLIFVPEDYMKPELNDEALVAWDGKRASARALGDAMHILGTKRRVTVLSVGDEASTRKLPGDDVMTLLGRHGIPAERLIRPVGPGGVARTILDACAEVGAGLLVMGAYEHSKFAEDVIGGVTRDIFGIATIPIFLSH